MFASMDKKVVFCVWLSKKLPLTVEATEHTKKEKMERVGFEQKLFSYS